MELHIDEDLKEFIAQLTEDEFETLGINICKNGCIEPITVWEHKDGSMDTIVDGHNRYAICKRFDVPFETVKIKFADKLAAMTWMYEKQKGRRNLTIVERLELARKLIEFESKFAKERKLANLKQSREVSKTARQSQSAEGSKLDLADNKKRKTLERIAKEINVSYDTAFKHDAIQRKGTEEQKEAVRTGQKKIGTVYKEIKAQEKGPVENKTTQCDIEKLVKNKPIKSPYLLIYYTKDLKTDEEMQAELFNCSPNTRLKMCADSIMRSISSICAKDTQARVKLLLKNVIQECEHSLEEGSRK